MFIKFYYGRNNPKEWPSIPCGNTLGSVKSLGAHWTDRKKGPNHRQLWLRSIRD